jgi:hypothetical protein
VSNVQLSVCLCIGPTRKAPFIVRQLMMIPCVRMALIVDIHTTTSRRSQNVIARTL